MMSRILTCSLVLSTIIGLTTHAATDEFRVRTQIGDDTTPPTIPTGLTATPVATSQIDLAWNASTDDYELSGYYVYRDDIHIATTTATNYSDLGLTASTTYTYYVTAFDWVGNVSASSSLVSTTTLAPPPPPVVATSTTRQGTRLSIELVRLEILPSRDSVIIRYETTNHVRSVIQWGRTISYELGSLAEQSFTKLHETRITGLTPGTLYKFSINGENNIGIRGVLTEGTFMTLPEEDTFPPGNVRNLNATRDGNDIVLSWINPEDPDLDKVRIVRSDRFYPSDPADGWVVYEGSGMRAVDMGMAIPGTRQYYTVFTYDANGNISSGAIVSILITETGVTPAPPPSVTDNRIKLSLSDFIFTQETERIRPEGSSISIDGGKQLTISLPYDKVPEHLKTIVVSLEDSREADLEFTFLLRINTAKTAYTATIAPLGVSGIFPIRISVFDYDTTGIGYVEGTLHATISFIPYDRSTSDSFFSYILSFLFESTGGYLLLFILLLVLLMYTSKRLMAAEW